MVRNKKRNSRSYKTTDLPYRKAKKRAKEQKTTLAKLLEIVVGLYAEGAASVQFDPTTYGFIKNSKKKK